MTGKPLSAEPDMMVLQARAEDVLEYAEGAFPGRHFIVIAVDEKGGGALASRMEQRGAFRLLTTITKAFKRAMR